MDQNILAQVFDSIPRGVDADLIARDLFAREQIIYCAGTFYEYREGCYCPISEEAIRRRVLDLVRNRGSMNKIKDIIYRIQGYANVEIDEINNTPFLNLKNGLFDLDQLILSPHDTSVKSTIQLEVNFDPSAKCEKWIKTLDEIFEGNQDKISTLQEFFGLCLTREVKYEKALLSIGEGSNGKSVILYILARLLGQSNCSAIPLEMFDNTHYLANLFGKLANISLETNAKSGMYDSTFKSIISGDLITADPKFKNPFSFRPFCKLIFAMNNLPRVDDKTDAFFRRLLILRFERQFKEQEQNKNLKDELIPELNGIFLWCLEGLKRLKQRGYFDIGEGMQKEISEYRKENNNVILFVEELCSLGPKFFAVKEILYKGYAIWCDLSGYKALGMIKFGKELAKHYKLSKDDRMTDGIRIWRGIQLTNGIPEGLYYSK